MSLPVVLFLDTGLGREFLNHLAALFLEFL